MTTAQQLNVNFKSVELRESERQKEQIFFILNSFASFSEKREDFAMENSVSAYK